MIDGLDPAPSPFVDWHSLFTKKREPEWIIEGVLARGRGHALYAKHGTGKSLFALWMATQLLAAGHIVIFLDYEMTEDDLLERLEDMGCRPEDLSGLRYALLPNLPALDTPAGGEALHALVDAERMAHPGRHICVFIDTIGRAVHGEENSNDTAQAFYLHSGLGLKQRGVTWMRLDHAGWENAHARGASAKGDDVDVVWRLELTEEGIRLRADKRRMGWVPEIITFDKLESPVLHYRRSAGSTPAGAAEVAGLLDELGAPLEAGMRAVKRILRDAGHGRRNEVVEAAQRHRRAAAESRGTPRGTLFADGSGDTSGDAWQESHNQGAGTPPGTLGDTPAAPVGDTSPPYRGDGLPVPDEDDDLQDDAETAPAGVVREGLFRVNDDSPRYDDAPRYGAEP